MINVTMGFASCKDMTHYTSLDQKEKENNDNDQLHETSQEGSRSQRISTKFSKTFKYHDC